MSKKITFVAYLLISLSSFALFAQFGAQGPQFISPDVAENGAVTFSILAPNAENVSLSTPGDIPGIDMRSGAAMQKDDEGVWSVTLGPVPPGAFRYSFNIDGVTVLDPRNPLTSESNMNSWSLFDIPGSDFMDTRNVTHGAVAEVTYYSSALERFRRMHVYTPPGYESGSKRYPVFYLLHGAYDSDDSWSSVGRAGFILDNLIADDKAKPMVVVMPDGHTGPFNTGSPRLPVSEFVMDFNSDIVPYIEENYRVYTNRKNTAIAGLSMGGGHTLNIAIPNLQDYAYIGVYSSGVFGLTGDTPGADNADGQTYEEMYLDVLKNDRLKRGLELFWFATGRDDFLIETSRLSVAMFKRYGFDVEYEETAGGHTWINWRNYLNTFSQRLFR